LNLAETADLLNARGDELDAVMAAARTARGVAVERQGRPGTVTFSPKVFIPLTRLCRDRCHYCTFATDPASLRQAGHTPFLTIDEVLEIATTGAQAGCKEALFTMGDQPEKRWPAAAQWLAAAGYETSLDYLRAAAIAVLEHTGLLPHLNPGVMSWEQMQRLRPVAPGMGLMLETTSQRLFTTPGAVHFGSPDKNPRRRRKMITEAGRLNIPFTTGLLVGIGETMTERAESILALRSHAQEFHHIQEVIVQNFRSKSDTAMRHSADLALPDYLASVATTRLVLGPHVSVQAPPNLTDLEHLRALLDAGVDDWGGVSPVTPDHVNPERPWPLRDALAAATRTAGFTLTERLTIHPQYVRDLNRWVDPRLHGHVTALATESGCADAEVLPTGAPWQEPDSYAHFASTVTAADESTSGPSGVSFPVQGNWQRITQDARDIAAPSGQRPVPAAVKAGLRFAESDPVALLAERNTEAAVALAQSSGEGLAALVQIADGMRRDVVGDDVTYVVNRNINFTNVCYTGCRFCAFAQREGDPRAQTLDLAEVGRRVDEAIDAGATEICMQGGIHPRMPAGGYLELAQEVTRKNVHLHAFSPMEVVNGAHRAGMTIREWLTQLRAAGVGSIPGTAAEILDDEVRWILTKGKLPTATWVEVITAAHEVGLPSTATMMYGHVDRPHHWIGHFRVLRRIQETTGGFTEFVGLPFIHHNAPLYLAGAARPGPSVRDDVAVTALSRVLLHGAVDNIQVSWVKLGPNMCAHLLDAGANDLGGTLLEESISNMAGSQFGTSMTVDQLRAIASTAGRPARERTTTYGVPRRADGVEILAITDFSVPGVDATG
jgi:FO synthase